MHLPEIDKYAHLKSVFHSWDPRVKLISFSFLILSIALLPNLLSASLGFFLVIILVLLSKIPFSFVLKQLKWVMLFILFFFIIMPLTVPGDIILRLNFLTVSKQGLKLSSLIALRAISICMIIFPMIGTMEFHKTLKALQRLKIPNKLIQTIMFTYRYIFVFLTELIRMLTAAKARLFKKKTNIHTLKITSNLIGMLFIRAFERTQRIYDAMVSRGYKGVLTTLDEFKLSNADFLKAFLIITLAVMLNLAR
ncbi:MAG: cobalt ECF transporter T component CbiQ [Candidatus Omnitrophica bacterium]|nr:cobalt ECF transporter T component CbiQ [Candidatus Omnitrophota bacterium]